MSLFARVRPDRDTPLLIVLGIAFSYFAVAVAGLVLLLAIGDLLIPGRQLPFAVNDREVSAAEFLLEGGLLSLPIIAFFWATGWGLHRHRPWARYLILAYHLVTSVVVLLTVDDPEESYPLIFQGCILLAFSGWYFFSKKNVVAYFSDQPPPRTPSPRPPRPIGITLLTMLLVSQAISGAGNSLIAFTDLLFPFPPRHLFGGVLLVHALISGTTAVGLWKLKSWAHRAIGTWLASLALLAGLMFAAMPAPMTEHAPSMLLALFAVLFLGLSLLLYRYVRRIVGGWQCEEKPLQ